MGSFGRNHARVYHELQKQGAGVELAAVVDSDAAQAQAVASQFGCSALTGVEELFGRVEAASVAVPTLHHRNVAAALMAAGIDVLIEKPLASTLAEADELLSLANANQRVVQVGHLERFNPAVRATIPLITQPMFFEVHRLSVFSPRSLDVDVVSGPDDPRYRCRAFLCEIANQGNPSCGAARGHGESGYRQRSHGV